VRRRLTWVLLYAVAMAAVEAAVVIYLRALHPMEAPVAALLAVIPGRLVAIEVGREAATLVMLVAVAVLAGRDRWERFLWFSVAFGAWDACYYGWLWLLIGWPPSLFTWDVLFLIPVPWLGPVLAPLIVSACLVTGGVWLLRRYAQGVAPRSAWPVWLLSAAGAALVLAAFLADYRAVGERATPPPFRWGVFGAGIALGLGAYVMAVRRPRIPR
jgi:hypothetical protein